MSKEASVYREMGGGNYSQSAVERTESKPYIRRISEIDNDTKLTDEQYRAMIRHYNQENRDDSIYPKEYLTDLLASQDDIYADRALQEAYDDIRRWFEVEMDKVLGNHGLSSEEKREAARSILDEVIRRQDIKEKRRYFYKNYDINSDTRSWPKWAQEMFDKGII